MKNLSLLWVIGLTFAIVLPFVFVPEAYALDSNQENKPLTAMTDVIGLDMSRYTVQLVGNSSDQPEIYGGLTQQTLTYSLESNESTAQFVCTFIDGLLTRYALYPLEGPVFYSKPLSSNLVSAAKEILQRNVLLDSNSDLIQRASNVLDKVTDVKSSNITTDDLTLQIIKSDELVSFIWWQTVNGIEFPLWLSINFANDRFKGFSDRSSLYHIGSSSVNISKEEAIQITKDLAKDQSTIKVSTTDGAYKEITFNLTDEHLVSELQVSSRDPFTMYPLWYVRFYFDNPYGGTDGFQAGIWADTGEVAYAQLTGNHEIVTAQPSIQAQDANNLDLSPYLFGAIAVIISAVVLLLVTRRGNK